MGGWSKPPSQFMAVVKGDLVTRRREITMEVLQGVVMTSPVDKGTYRASHQVTIDSITMDYDLDRRDESGDATIQAGAQVIGTINTPFGESTVQTNLPYAEVLENGHSDWAPQGVYGPTFAAIVEKYR